MVIEKLLDYLDRVILLILGYHTLGFVEFMNSFIVDIFENESEIMQSFFGWIVFLESGHNIEGHGVANH